MQRNSRVGLCSLLSVFGAALKNSALPRATEGEPADRARKCLIQRNRDRTCARRATTDQGREGHDRCCLECCDEHSVEAIDELREEGSASL